MNKSNSKNHSNENLLAWWGILTELSLRNLAQTSTERPSRAPQGTSGSTIVVLTRAERWVRTVDRWRQYASPGEERSKCSY